MMGILITDLTPKSKFTSDDMLGIVVPDYHFADVQVEDIQPCCIVAIGSSEVVPNTHVEIEWPIL
jgi:hypothetical protein